LGRKGGAFYAPVHLIDTKRRYFFSIEKLIFSQGEVGDNREKWGDFWEKLI
jgi:hypothetical protein